MDQGHPFILSFHYDPASFSGSFPTKPLCGLMKLWGSVALSAAGGLQNGLSKVGSSKGGDSLSKVYHNDIKNRK